MNDKLSIDTFVEQISLESGFDIDTSKNFVSELFGLLGEKLLEKDELHIRNFGVFKTLLHEDKLGINPQTQEPLIIPRHHALHFHPSKNLVSTINQAQGYSAANDIAYDGYLGWKHYLAISLVSIMAVFLFFFMPKSTLPTQQVEHETVYLTVPHGEHHWSVSDTSQVKVETVKKQEQVLAVSPLGNTEPVAVVKKEAAVSYGTHLIHNKDSLSSIAKAYYGHAEYWPLIYQENKDAIKDPDRIYAGHTLKIPQVDQDRTRENKDRFAQAYVYVYSVYHKLDKIKSSQWVLWLGMTKIDDCLLSAYDSQIREEDIKAVKRYLACNFYEPLKNKP